MVHCKVFIHQRTHSYGCHIAFLLDTQFLHIAPLTQEQLQMQNNTRNIYI